MATTTPPTDQRAGVRPIAFVLDNAGSIGSPVTLPIRPEDLTRNEPSRVSVHQTLGRDVSGWVDNFGEGLPSVTIAGHTGWGAGGRPDGVEAFNKLNTLVQHDYHKAKQDAIDGGRDPSAVKLLFVDMLDDFCWNVTPTQFVLRRSKSRPLLFQYNITLQAVSTSVDDPLVLLPQFGGFAAGMGALGGAIGAIEGFIGKVRSMVSTAVGFINGGLSPIAGAVHQFMGLSTNVFRLTSGVVGALKGGASAITNNLIGIAGDLAKTGVNVFRTISSIAGLPAQLKADLSQVAAAYNEVLCIFKNSLRPKQVYEDYSPLYGASNCSSTTGGSPASIYADRNAFDLIQTTNQPVSLSSSAISSMSSLSRSDPVLAPMPVGEMARHLNNVVGGVVVVA
jgi:hypothetical protein